MPTEEPNYLAHAFKSQYNLIALATALGFAVLGGTFLPLIVAAGVEMVVLPLVSGSPRFQRLIRARTSEEEEEKDAARQRMEASEMLQYMPEAERSRYDVDDASCGDAQRGSGAGSPALCRAAPDDIQHIGAGRDIQQHTRGHKQQKVVSAEHGSMNEATRPVSVA